MRLDCGIGPAWFSGSAGTSGIAHLTFRTAPSSVTSVVVMWLDYALIHHGLVANDLGVVSVGMIIMLAAAAVAYYLG